jgi:hypothetical protein
VLVTFSPVIRRTPQAVEGNFIIEREMRREAEWGKPVWNHGNHRSGGGSDGVQRRREYGAAAHDVPKLPGHAELAPGPERSAEVAAAVSGENGRVGGQRELPQLINTSLLLK